jgi:glutathione S-transferase
MRLYFIPFACSLAVRIAFEEAGLSAEYVQVAPGDSSLPDGRSFREINPLGQVPVVELDSGEVLVEGPAILQYIADLAPASGLAPAPDSKQRYELQRWLNFTSTELHKYVFAALLNPKAPAEAKAYALANAAPRLDHLSNHLEGRDFLLDRFTVADAYLLSVLNWCESAGVDIKSWPVLAGYRARIRQWPSVARAIQTERPLLKAA